MMYWMGERVVWLFDQVTMFTYVPYPLPKGLRWYVTDENGEQLYPDDEPILPHLIFSGSNEKLTRDSWRNIKTSKFWSLKKEVVLLQYFPMLAYTNVDKAKRAVLTNVRTNRAVLLNTDGTLGEDVTERIQSDDCDIHYGSDILMLIERVIRVPMYMINSAAMSMYTVDEILQQEAVYGSAIGMLYKLVNAIDERLSLR